MIDTDKYEDWTDDYNTWEQYAKGIDYEPDAQLIADAPLLLAEVEELQAWKKLVSEIVRQQDGPHLREMLKDVIE